jgi:hypothetical protein
MAVASSDVTDRPRRSVLSLDMKTSESIRVVASDLVGNWRGTHCEVTIDWLFGSDGVLSGKILVGDRISSDFVGTWAVEDDYLITRYERDACGNINPGSWDRDRIIEYSGSHFVIRTCSGDRRHTRIT